MIRAHMIAVLAGIGAVALAGCGSSASAPGGVLGPGVGAGKGGITWLDDGVKHTSQFATAAQVKSATTALLEITGGDPLQGIAMAIDTPPPLLPGIYTCGVTGTNIIVSFSYNSAGSYLTCTVELKTIGATAGTHVTGTFSATLATTGGGTKAITAGTFDVTQTISSI